MIRKNRDLFQLQDAATISWFQGTARKGRWQAIPWKALPVLIEPVYPKAGRGRRKKGNQWYFGMKAHIGVDADSGLLHTVTTTASNVADVTRIEHLLHGTGICPDVRAKARNH